MARDEDPPNRSRADPRRLVLLSFLMLFVELMLIRWASAFVLYISYFANFVLLASFLGIGLGFLLRPELSRRWLERLPLLLGGFLCFVLIFQVQVPHVGGRSLGGLFGAPALPIWVMLPALFLGVVAVMASVATGVASVFGTLEPLTAYRLDILGSLAGIATFSLASLLSAPPIVWALVAAGLIVATSDRPLESRAQILGIAAILLALGIVSFLPGERWSPYYRVTESSPSSDGLIGIKVNGLPHQAMIPYPLVPSRQPFYLYPYRHLGNEPLDTVLVIGAGNGNDVVVALANGARHIDAVEIDPVIQSLGRRDHPDDPYSSPRVSAYVNDGRAFLQQHDTKYNLIIFALPDSLTLVSGQASLRLESYLFTLQAMEEVRDHLASGGAFTMYNYYRPAVFERFAETIRQAFGHSPCIDTGPGQLGTRTQAVLTVGLAPTGLDCATPWTSDGDAIAATDDWPFPYLAGRSIPNLYALTIVLVLAVSLLLVRSFGGSIKEMRDYADLFFMGAAFLLLETKNVVQFALLFGTTWFVNALVFGGILLAVLAAIEIARRWALPRPSILYAMLLLALVIAWTVQPPALLDLPFGLRFIAATAVAFAPIFLANLVFAQRFRAVSASRVAFAANLLGAMVGGLLEYIAMLTGYRALLVIVGLLYFAAFLARKRTPSPMRLSTSRSVQ